MYMNFFGIKKIYFNYMFKVFFIDVVICFDENFS